MTRYNYVTVRKKRLDVGSFFSYRSTLCREEIGVPAVSAEVPRSGDDFSRAIPGMNLRHDDGQRRTPPNRCNRRFYLLPPFSISVLSGFISLSLTPTTLTSSVVVSPRPVGRDIRVPLLSFTFFFPLALVPRLPVAPLFGDNRKKRARKNNVAVSTRYVIKHGIIKILVKLTTLRKKIEVDFNSRTTANAFV